MGKYSQNNEDHVILDYFNGKSADSATFTRTFIDIGANDGLTFSNTRALVEQGWKGVFVEPSPKAFEKLKENYSGQKGLYFYNFALGVTNSELDFSDSGTHIGTGDHGLLSTLVDEEKERWPGQQYEKIKVQCYRWKTFLNRLLIKQFDVISIDIEGMEVQLMNQMDFRNTALVCAEFNGKEDVKKDFDKILSGFKVIYTSAENLIYAR